MTFFMFLGLPLLTLSLIPTMKIIEILQVSEDADRTSCFLLDPLLPFQAKKRFQRIHVAGSAAASLSDINLT
jgi:hypothetical protein